MPLDTSCFSSHFYFNCAHSPGPVVMLDSVSVSQLQMVNYVEVSATALFIFEYFLTLDDEIKFIWGAQWGIAKSLFVLARYIPFLSLPLAMYYFLGTHVDPDACNPIVETVTTLYVLGIVFSECEKRSSVLPPLPQIVECYSVMHLSGIFSLRVYAIWNRSKYIGILLIAIITGGIVSLAVILSLFFPTAHFVTPPLPTISGCYKVTGSKVILGAFVVIMVSEAVILFLTAYRAHRHIGPIQSPLFINLVRSGVFYCLVMFLFSLSNVLVIFILPLQYSQLLERFQAVLHAVLATRMQLHLRKVDNMYLMRTSVTVPLSSICYVTRDLPATPM
ncbi:hypothetical protein SERLADRAFT_459596 [Serpula lacrymans var. lacrymans S7.9]|uniref:DUF6533 domain-containing protein n=1 Tax=Serpula lacrymans var. lacrymans (strain S7.9) TaxID=578457 RepID=F8NKM1_SERL9|nr:uncharacterized protein SERLADRAFT_459596 [Serpula lacrymans var. lacrymans S7.9]EGO28793.1 hypothetical protein SERLADRAFT_459596 [Serpula lacrymans var. lacrymans S7.9]